MDQTFPVSEWDRLFEQAELMVNLLCNSQVNPKLSSYAYIDGVYDFNKIPLAPPGTKVTVHLKLHNDHHGATIMKWAFI